MTRINLFTLILTCLASHTRCEVPFEESLALADFHNATHGGYWYPYEWNVSDIYNNPCSLQFVGCDEAENHVIVINININNGLEGSLPDSLGNLTFLQI